MKCISLWQPWATLMALGIKTNETRSWATSYRGPLAIHAARQWTLAQRAVARRLFTLGRVEFDWNKRRPHIWSYVNAFDRWTGLPRGGVVCVVELYDCVPADPLNWPLDLMERECGDYRPGRFIWKTRKVQPLDRPYPCKGRQGFFELEDRLFASELERLRAA